MRICLIYDCLYPYTVGGAERWYRNLALRLRDAGHEVTYLTLRQWDGEFDDLHGIDVRLVGRGWPSTPATGAASCRHSSLAWGCCGTCCVTAGASTSSTRRRFPTSRC